MNRSITKLGMILIMLIANANAMSMTQTMGYASFIKTDLTYAHTYAYGYYMCIDFATDGYKNASLKGYKLYYAIVPGHCLLASEFNGKYLLWDPCLKRCMNDYYRSLNVTVFIIDPMKMTRGSVVRIDWKHGTEIAVFQSNDRTGMSGWNFEL